MKTFLKKLKRRSGQSMAEFAVTTAMMATLATTAAPKFSGVGEGAKGKKTEAEIDKIMKGASNFYSAKVTSEGRGRFPGQEKYNVAVGGYGGELLIADGNLANAQAAQIALGAVYTKLETFNSYEDDASDWCSVFGTDYATYPSGANVSDDAYEGCDDCSDSDPAYGLTGADEFVQLFNGNALNSKFQDGHFIYVVVPGGGSGTGSFPPVIVVADLENPSDFNNSLEP